MASTNKTTNYELSQYIGTDKPTYLGDYNSDMLKIDTQMKTNADNIQTAITSAQTANTNANNANNTAQTANTTAQSANSTAEQANTTANNANSVASSALSTANTANSKADTNASDILDLQTDVQTVQTNVSKFNLSTYETIPTSDITITGGGSLTNRNIQVAKNSDGSLAKIYGQIDITTNSGNNGNVVIQTSLRPESAININGIVYRQITYSGYVRNTSMIALTINTDGTVVIPYVHTGLGSNESCRLSIFACLLYIKDFGDTPITPSE